MGKRVVKIESYEISHRSLELIYSVDGTFYEICRFNGDTVWKSHVSLSDSDEYEKFAELVVKTINEFEKTFAVDYHAKTIYDMWLVYFKGGKRATADMLEGIVKILFACQTMLSTQKDMKGRME